MSEDSINHVFVINDPKKVEAFLESLEKAEKAPKFEPKAAARYVTDPEEIDKLMDSWKKKHKK